jgi:uncharacterized protein YutE (UPF0331/DUF86 family)
MRSVDPERLEKLIGSMRGALLLLRELRDLPDATFLEDAHKQSSAKYNFTAAIEAAIDMASHLISRRGLRAPEDYADTFEVLSEAGIVDADFAVELKKMARFRNRLVHLYWDVDVMELRRILTSRLDDFETFISAIGADLARERGSQDQDEIESPETT